ncbi:hypothetical protein SporoP8_12515 [Sporosarcina ureae]|uniref:hypothetical protein n=1 Tax=Sporosarcina ureae TaxID=1571 RepID=UPI000A14854B|nr:hypothetical protein [Sporosarcina ureae]ARJ39624.1 hypothetical protein SporoP8_12515 [Sporosarcina ureae]
MKRRLIILLSIVLALIAVSGGYLLYIFQFKEYNVADQQIDRILEHPYHTVLPNGTRLVVDHTGGTIKKEYAEKENTGRKEFSSNPDEMDSKESPISTHKASIPTKVDSNSEKYPERITVAQIKNKYESVITNFHKQTDDKYYELIEHAKNEYATKGKNVSYAYRYTKYNSAVEALELQSDSMFNEIMNSVERSLESNGYHKAYSNSFQDEYKEKKKLRRDKVQSDAVKQ